MGDRHTGGDTNRVQAVMKSYRIVQYIREHYECSISEVAEGLDIHPSTITVHLQTLEDLGLVFKTPDGNYRLSLRFLELAGDYRNNMDIYQVARSEIDKISQQTNEVASIGVEENGQRVLLYRTEPVEGISDNAPVGQFTKMHWTAVGKALLSMKSDREVEEIVETYGLPKATERTIVDVDALFEEIETIREQGYSIEDEEHIEGVRAVAVPISEIDGPSGPAAISVAGPKHRLDQDRIENELVDILQKSENIIALDFKHYS